MIPFFQIAMMIDEHFQLSLEKRVPVVSSFFSESNACINCTTMYFYLNCLPQFPYLDKFWLSKFNVTIVLDSHKLVKICTISGYLGW